MTPTADTIRAKTGFLNQRDPELIERVIEIKRRSQYFAGEGFRIVPRRAVGER